MTPGKYRVIGRDTPKIDGIDKVTGRATFGADVYLPGMLVGKVLRSPYAHAIIKSIDIRRAEALSGVKAVITSSDIPDVLPGALGRQGAITDREFYLSRELLAREKALFHGHAVAVVAATSESIAEEALSLIDVDYEVLPHTLDPEVAMQNDAPLLHETLHTKSQHGTSDEASNLAEHWELSRGDVERGFAEADSIIEESFSTQVVHHGYVEPDPETAHAHPAARSRLAPGRRGAPHLHPFPPAPRGAVDPGRGLAGRGWAGRGSTGYRGRGRHAHGLRQGQPPGARGGGDVSAGAGENFCP